jgi:hypothetical protein
MTKISEAIISEAIARIAQEAMAEADYLHKRLEQAEEVACWFTESDLFPKRNGSKQGMGELLDMDIISID